jgi:hypothetical protein
MSAQPNKRIAVLALAFGVMACGPAFAHHSFAMFDATKTRELVGVVKDYQATNPHGYLDVMVTAKSGHTQEWSVEAPSVTVMKSHGISKDTFKVGDKVTVTIYPLRDGSTGGQFLYAVLPNGKIVGKEKPPE